MDTMENNQYSAETSFINTYAGALNVSGQLHRNSQGPAQTPDMYSMSSEEEVIDVSIPRGDGELVYRNGSGQATPAKYGSRFRLLELPPPRDAQLLEFNGPDGVAFRAKRKHRHATWAGTFQSRPELYIQPQSVEEVQTAVSLARRCRARVVAVGSGHSPSDLTCTSSWLMDMSGMHKILHVEGEESASESEDGDEKSSRAGRSARVVFQAGISLRELNKEMARRGLTMPNLGSIDEQSLAGAVATGTHGSSLRHGLISESIRGLRIVLADGRAVWCSQETRADLFQAALVSLGALGIVTEIEFEMVGATNIEWEQRVETRQQVLDNWDKGLWTQAEFVRCWWMPYTDRMILWKADKTEQPTRKPRVGWYGGALGYYIYLNLLWLGHHVPRLIPAVEWFVIGMQFGFRAGAVTSGVDEQREGLLLDCLFSQHVNEWALPLAKGPEAITRIARWLAGDAAGARIPFASAGVYVHCPIEVRVSDGARADSPPRALLDPTCPAGPTVYLNAIMYRPYGLEAPGRQRYYEAFEWLMQDLGGRPHWAKNFCTVAGADMRRFYGDALQRWLGVRDGVDPRGMFAGAWHRRNLLDGGGGGVGPLPLEEAVARERRDWWTGGTEWSGRQGWSGGLRVDGAGDAESIFKVELVDEEREDEADGYEISSSRFRKALAERIP